jgi:tripartite-type tricarboxylate transporter receptor subunit TctC
MKNRKREICTSGSVRDEAGQPPHLLGRRKFLHLAAGAAGLPAMSRFAWAQTYPARPVRIVVGLPAGSGVDIIARLMGQWLSERLGQPFVIENRLGVATNLATDVVVRAPPDGYTLLLVNLINAVNASLFDNLTFNFIRDIAPVSSISHGPFILAVNHSLPAKTVPEFIAYAKTNPGKVNFASSGTASTSHIAGELFKMMAGIDMLHVPYRGEPPAITDLLGGRVQVCFGTLPGSIEYVRAGKLLALAVTTKTRSEALPDVPTVDEFLSGYEVRVWNGIGAPKNTPAEVVDRLNREVNAGLADPKMKQRLADLGATAFVRAPAEFGRFIADETEKWAKVVKSAGIKPE